MAQDQVELGEGIGCGPGNCCSTVVGPYSGRGAPSLSVFTDDGLLPTTRPRPQKQLAVLLAVVRLFFRI
jgi:hypothetical protein